MVVYEENIPLKLVRRPAVGPNPMIRRSVFGLLVCLFPCCVVFDGPGLMGVLTLFLSFLGALLVGLTRSTWYGLRVWLVYIRGLLVLFMFFCALTPNPNFSLGVSWEFLFWPGVVLFLRVIGLCDLVRFSCSEGRWIAQPFVM